MVIQPDGKIVVGGKGRDPDQGNNSNSFLARYNINGSLDTSFGTGGKIQTSLTNQSDEIYAIALQSDGRIVTRRRRRGIAIRRFLADEIYG